MADRKKHLSFTISDFYIAYKKKKGKVSRNTYLSLFQDFFSIMGRRIIHENYIFRMPSSIGAIFAKAGKNKKTYYVDFKTSREVGKYVKFLNRHTFGHYFMYYWDKGTVRFKNMSFYRFKPTDSAFAFRAGVGKRTLGRHIKEKAADPNQRGFIRI